MGKSIAFITLGCKLNYAETATYEREFVRHGYTVVPWQERADVYVINTCAVTQRAESKSRNEIRRVRRINPDAVVAVTGCAAQLRREQIAAMEEVSLVFGAEDKSALVPAILSLGQDDIRENTREDIRKNTPEAVREAGPLRPFFGAYSSGEDRTRAFLKVQDGCDNFCAYCTVPFARGRSRNAPVSEIVSQARQIAAAGIKEVVITGVNTGDFGRTTGESFLDLLKALDAVEGIERYRISSIEPNLLTDEIIDWTASSTKVLPHFHIPLQSGSDEMLRRMGRRYSTDLFASRMERIRSKMETPGGPKVFFGLDIMVGLPGETDEMFEQGQRFVEEMHPAFLHVFPYSRRPGTRAALMPGQVPDKVKTRRAAQLEELSESLHRSFVEAHRGMRAEVLFESACKDGMMSGYTRNYIRVSRPYDSRLVGQIAEVTI